jgi:hypothetical protein
MPPKSPAGNPTVQRRAKVVRGSVKRRERCIQVLAHARRSQAPHFGIGVSEQPSGEVGRQDVPVSHRLQGASSNGRLAIREEERQASRIENARTAEGSQSSEPQGYVGGRCEVPEFSHCSG